MYIKSLNIQNLRNFKKVALDFQYPARPVEEGLSTLTLPNVNLLLGNNGQGKTTVLRAIALSAISSIIQESGYVPYSMVRRKPGLKSLKDEPEGKAVLEANYVLHDQDVGPEPDLLKESSERRTRVVIQRIKDLERIRSDTAQIEEDPVWQQMYDNESPAFLMVGYGATRRLEQPENYDAGSRKRMVLRYLRIAGLFQESFSLIPLERWLPELKIENPGRYTQVVHLIDRLLEKPFSFHGHYDRDEYYFKQGRSLVPLGAMSDGYRSYIGWIADLLYHICMGCPSGKKLVENKGIVMVDEVDLHLHPSWQRTVVPMLARTFPNLQFIVTSHSPIITG
ncbi:MAG: AAA family ATPase, partial [Deltaproteobacteria bacterium]|nr:AAA family ATPase [Deltaproteobacteria bacterium]